MNKETIKKELIKRVAKLIEEKSSNRENLSGIDKLKRFSQKIDDTEPFTNEIICILNSIIDENKIILNQTDKEELIDYIKPTVKELIIKYIKK